MSSPATAGGASGDLEVALIAARAAGAVLIEGAFRGHSSDEKATNIDLCTEFDRRAERAVLDVLAVHRPADSVLAEESGTHNSGTGRRWIIDPLDGTTNFSHGLPFFCVSVGLEVEGRIEAGVVLAPALGWTFYAARGQGAFRVIGGVETRLQVSRTDDLRRSLLATGFPYDRATSDDNNFQRFMRLELIAQGVRRAGAAALDMSLVAAGWFDGYWEKKVKPWDVAAGSLLVLEAGGSLSNLEGQAFDVDGCQVVATNGHIHHALVDALA